VNQDAHGAQAINRENARAAAVALAGEAGADAAIAEAQAQLEQLFATPAVAAQLERLATALVRHRRLDAAQILAITQEEA
jgi:hypothetical protein